MHKMCRNFEINNRGKQVMVLRQRMKQILLKPNTKINNNLECESDRFVFLKKVLFRAKEICNKQNNQPLYCITRKKMNKETKILSKLENMFKTKFDFQEQSNKQNINRNKRSNINPDNLRTESVKLTHGYQKLSKIVIKKQPRYKNRTFLNKINHLNFIRDDIDNNLCNIIPSSHLNINNLDLPSEKDRIKSYQEKSEFYGLNDNLKNDLLKIFTDTEDIANQFQINLRSFDSLPKNHVKKIGEATFSDVFCVKQKIFKIIPLKKEKCKVVDFPLNVLNSDNIRNIDHKNSENHNSDVFVNIYCETDTRKNMDEDESLMLFKDFYRESFILKILSKEKNVCQFFDSCVLKDGYTKEYIEAWNDFKQFNTSENIFPLNFTKDQLFGCLIMEIGGNDLEKFVFKNKAEVKEVFFQTCYFLADMEIKYEFEHRDLHWGNILINRLPKNKRKNKKKHVNNYSHTLKNKYKISHNKSVMIDDSNQNINELKENIASNNQFVNIAPYKLNFSENKEYINSEEIKEFKSNDIISLESKNITQIKEGVKISKNEKFISKFLNVKIIDFSLSRLNHKGTIIYKDLNEFDWLFEDETIIGEEHLKIYPKMKSNNQNDWKKFSPENNVLWLEYLLFKLQEKGKNFRLVSFFQKAKKILKFSHSAKDVWKAISKIKTCIP
ncbi:haspin-like serine/threonine-protein kinase [Hamiltosporidium magnivora]|uniref:non-specific serine/threonine protein kinase n=1 Tax=Hamiltosporidium magnivora TaxID=148818 RepID=A0A4Q9L268_9MICR|nr:haspin-like serine/threonine-protein kinase [Hamiltosporidium magnivora]